MEDDRSKRPDVDLGEFDIVFDVKDVAKSVDFYTRLGFQRTVVRSHDGKRPISSEANPDWATFRCGQQNVHLMSIGMNMITFVVADPQAAAADLRARGLDPAPAGPGGSGASLTDPDGNVIYIMKNPPEK